MDGFLGYIACAHLRFLPFYFFQSYDRGPLKGPHQSIETASAAFRSRTGGRPQPHDPRLTTHDLRHVELRDHAITSAAWNMHRPCSFCNEMAGVTCLRLLPCALPVWASVTDGGGMCGYAITVCKGNSRKLVTPQKDAVATINIS